MLIVDDEKSILDLLTVVFKKEGYKVETSHSGPKALELIEKNDFSVIISDIKLPQLSGMEILRRVKDTKPYIPVIMVTAYGTIKQAVEALKEGAMDYVVKPFDVEELKIIVSQGLERGRLKQENILLKKQLREKYGFDNIIGKSKRMMEIFSLIEKIAATDSTVIVNGESGTGKELAARAIHLLSRYQERPFVSINCGAVPDSLLESELFGHMRGSFTGAVADKKGMFEVAEGGVLFLDEVGEMSPMTQVKLLRALQDKKIRRVGGTEEIPVDIRIIAATNQDLKRKIEEGKFREDLFYRLNVLSLVMPPLRKRKEDLPLLVSHFIKKYCQEMGRKTKRIAPEVMNVFESYPWPGNVRELENVIERVVAIEEREIITRDSLPEELLAPHKKPDTTYLFEPGFSLNSHLDDIAKNYIKQARQAAGGKLRETASLLGISYRTLRYLIDKYGLKSNS
ncbi:MAG: sigma-54-dependent Fis family transcriptional regulator [Candidatus Aminicenantes bacterium]|nr:sigma-54-dependent Fis family transcriptional regulator [Candidatus Aminicenantes bacterium]MCK4758940.1 sigma-54-dependent Fis family transcriptional regulator [Candidatus Aminicenantes bacterium]